MLGSDTLSLGVIVCSDVWTVDPSVRGSRSAGFIAVAD